MDSIIFMDQEFQQLAEMAAFQSLSLTRSFWGVGAVSLTAHPNAPGAEAVRPGVLLFLASQPQHVMIVEDVTRTRDKLTANGAQMKAIARRRIAVPPLSLPARLWKYAGGAWTQITDPAAIRQALDSGAVYQGFQRPATPQEGMLWLDMTELGAVYDWGSDLGEGQMVYDLGTAQLRSKYQNFGWDRYTGPAEDAYLHFARNNLIAPEDPKRAIPGLYAGESLHRGLSLPWQARFGKLADLFEDIGEATGMGWDILPDYEAKGWRFTVLQGRNLGAPAYDGTVPEGPVAVISEEMGNAKTITRKQRTSGMSSTVYVGGAGEDENRLVLSVGGEAQGLGRREIWAEAGGVDDTAMLRLYGENKLASAAATDTLDADVIDQGACRYGVDFELGDIVGVAGAGAQMNARITEVTQTFEAGGRTLKLTFGDAPVTVGGVLSRWGRDAAR